MKTGLHRQKCASARRSVSTSTRARKKKKRTDQLSVNRPVVRGERDGRPPRFGCAGGPQQPYLGFHGAESRRQAQIFAIIFCLALTQKRQHGRGDAYARIDDEFASDSVVFIGKHEIVGRFGLEGGRVGCR